MRMLMLMLIRIRCRYSTRREGLQHASSDEVCRDPDEMLPDGSWVSDCHLTSTALHIEEFFVVHVHVSLEPVSHIRP